MAYSQVESGELNFLAGLPQSVVSLRSGEGTLEVEPVPATCGLLMNGAAEPFDNEFVRKALAAVVDQEALTAAMGGTLEYPYPVGGHRLCPLGDQQPGQ